MTYDQRKYQAVRQSAHYGRFPQTFHAIVNAIEAADLWDGLGADKIARLVDFAAAQHSLGYGKGYRDAEENAYEIVERRDAERQQAQAGEASKGGVA